MMTKLLLKLFVGMSLYIGGKEQGGRRDSNTPAKTNRKTWDALERVFFFRVASGFQSLHQKKRGKSRVFYSIFFFWLF